MTEFLEKMQDLHMVTYTLLALGITAAAGLALGGVEFKGIGLGISGVLFAGLMIGHFGVRPDEALIEFLRDAGLVLFVYSIGIKVGPGFFRSFKKQGMGLNVLACLIVLGGAGLTVFLATWWGLDIEVAAGIFAGATTNTPSLGAAQETLKSLGASPEQVALPTLGYAVAYPFGILGILLAMVMIRKLARVDIARETGRIEREEKNSLKHLERRSLLANKGLDGESVETINSRHGLTISRMLRRNKRHPELARPEMIVRTGDKFLAIGSAQRLADFQLNTGAAQTTDLMDSPGQMTWRNLIVTRDDVVGKSLGELGLDGCYEVTPTRVLRGEDELLAKRTLRLQLGDRVRVVGGQAELDDVGRRLGNSKEALDRLNLIPIFLGICAGILIGYVPISLPGIPSPIRIGLAGGPLVAALILGRIGGIGRLSWHMPPVANATLRDLGITMFLAAVGLRAGGHFVETLVTGDGLLWLGMGALVTLLPLLVVGLAGALLMKINFVRICGVLSGSMTDPPALAFATSMTKSDAVAVSYAAVYPTAMIARIILVQVIILVFHGKL